MKTFIRFVLFDFIILLCILTGCTYNPFDDDEINLANRVISGKLSAEYTDNQTDIYVWLDTFAIGDFTSSDGKFQIVIPQPESQPNGGLTGDFFLYYYLDNYNLVKIPIQLDLGKIVYSTEFLDGKGKVMQDIVMKRGIIVRTTAQPSSVPANYAGSIYLMVDITNVSGLGLIEIHFPGDSENNLAMVYLVKDDKNPVIIDRSIGDYYPPGIENKPMNLMMTINIANLNLSPGNYKIYPVIYFEHFDEGVPEIWQSLDITNPDHQYLKIPKRIQPGELTITN